MFHKTNLGSFGTDLPCDLEGYVPESGDDVAKFSFDAYSDFSPEEWAEYVAAAVAATDEATKALDAWNASN